MKGKALVPILLCTLLFLTVGCGSEAETPSYTGTVEATQVDVGAEIGGRIETVAVEEGEQVTAGQILVKLDTTNLALQLDQAQSALDTAKAKLAEGQSGATPEQIEQARAEVSAAEAVLEGAEKALEMSQIQLQRITTLNESGVTSPQELDNAQSQYDQKLAARDTAQAKLKAAFAGLKLLQAGTKKETLNVLRKNVDQAGKASDLAKASLDKATIMAPVAGVATSVNVEAGEIVNPGASLVTLFDQNNLWVEVYIPEKYLGQIRVGNSATISITPYPEREFQGKVTFISSQAEFTPERANTEEERADTVFKVRVKIMEDTEMFKPGMSAQVTLPDFSE